MKRRDRFNEWNITEHVNFVNNFSTKLTAHAQPSYNEKPQEREGTIVVGNTCVQCKNSQVNCVLKVRHITLCLLSNEWQLVCTHELRFQKTVRTLFCMYAMSQSLCFCLYSLNEYKSHVNISLDDIFNCWKPEVTSPS